MACASRSLGIRSPFGLVGRKLRLAQERFKSVKCKIKRKTMVNPARFIKFLLNSLNLKIWSASGVAVLAWYPQSSEHLSIKAKSSFALTIALKLFFTHVGFCSLLEQSEVASIACSTKSAPASFGWQPGWNSSSALHPFWQTRFCLYLQRMRPPVSVYGEGGNSVITVKPTAC